MSLLFRPSEHDRQALQSAVRSLQETTVAGLAAALSWRTRKVERLLVDELTRPGTVMAYDPARRVVRWAPPVPVTWSAPPPATAPAPDARRPVDLGPALAAPLPVFRSGGLRAQCPSCHVTLVASTSSSLDVCPQCGRLFSSRAATASRPEIDRAPAPTTSNEPAHASTTIGSDRRSQELLAAYVTAQPIPCPRCRTHLRHKAFSEYACPSCGETVRFGATGAPSNAGAPKMAGHPPSPPTLP